MNNFIEFTYRDKNNKNATAYYNMQDGTLREKEYNLSEDVYIISKLDMMIIWFIMLTFGLLVMLSITMFKWMFISGKELWLATFICLILNYICVEIIYLANIRSAKINIENTNYVDNSIEKMQGILRRHDEYNIGCSETNKYVKLNIVLFTITLIFIVYSLLTNNSVHLIIFLLNFLTGVLTQIQMILALREPDKKIREQIKNGEVLINNGR